MSVELVKEAIQNFLVDPTPEVLCIKGKWGTGKTYAWTEAVKQAALQTNSPIALKKYAYVSLFGVNDASDIIQSVFANTNDVASLNGYNPLSQKPSKMHDLLKGWKKLPVFAAEHTSVPYISGLGGVARALLSNLVTKTLVCFDDFERKSKNVSINEVMGTIAQLRDARDCKIVLILNEDSLDEKEREEFQRYSEKVINRAFKFDPSPSEAAAIAFHNRDDSLNVMLAEAASELEITNIRILQKISVYAESLKMHLGNIDDEVTKNVMRSLVVIVWSITSPKGEGAPGIGYLLKTRRGQRFGSKKADYSDEEIKWGALLDKYGFSHCDEFDCLLIEDIKNGFFNETKLRCGVEA